MLTPRQKRCPGTGIQLKLCPGTYLAVVYPQDTGIRSSPTISSECCLDFVTLTGDCRMYCGLMGYDLGPKIFCRLFLDR